MRAFRLSIGWLIGLFTAALLLWGSITIAQQDSIQLAISPQVLDTSANRGDVIVNQFRLTNGSDEEITINAIPKNFTPQGEDGAIDLTTDDTSYSLAKWISVEPSQVKIAANKTQDFKVTISVPANAEPGSRFGSVVFATTPPDSQGSGAVVSQEIAPVILVTVAGDLVESAEIVDFYSTKTVWSNEPEAIFEARIKNNGNVHFKPTGVVEIKDMFGNNVAKVSLEDKNVLPDSIRKIDAKWPIEGFKMGKYDAELTIVYGNNDEIVKSKTTFYIIPYQIILPVVAILSLMIFVLVKYRKRLALALKVLSGKEAASKENKE
jgi:hypothetical protein